MRDNLAYGQFLSNKSSQADEIGMMNEKYAKPGDTIRVVQTGHELSGLELVVVGRPEKYGNNCIGEENDIWINHPKGDYAFLSVEWYEIIRTPQSTQPSVEKSVRKQTHDNLRSVFGH